MDESVWETLQNDELFKQFLCDDFDARNYASKALQDVAVAQQRAKLTAGINLVDKELHDQVSLHYEDLLSQATRIETLEGVLQMMQNRIQTLVSAADCLRTKIVDPFSRMASQTAMLARLQSACEILRRILRIMYLSKRLQAQLKGGIKEITKAAQCLSELEYLFQGVNLNGIDVIEKDQRIIRNARKEVEKQAQQMLHLGMESHNQSQVATSLQVFHNLNILSETVNKLVLEAKNDLQKSVSEALDMKFLSSQNSSSNLSSLSKGPPGRAAIPTVGNTAAFRAALWTNIEKMMDKIYANCGNIKHLHVVLTKKRDPVSHVCFLELLKKDGYANIMISYWDMVTSILTEEFSTAAEESSFVKQAFEGEYPKLLRLYSDLWKRLEQFNVNMNMNSGMIDLAEDQVVIQNSNETQNVEFLPEKSLRDTLIPFENAYLSRSLSRLFDPINLVFSGSNCYAPTKDEIDSIIRTISSELSVANVDVILSKTVANNVAKTIKLFTVKCEQLLCTDGEASQVIDSPNAGQTLNANIVNILELFHQQVLSLIESLSQYPADAKHFVIDALKSIVLLMKSAVQPLLSSISDAIESIILTIHSEDFSSESLENDARMTDVPCSLYMKELQSFISRVQSDYLNQFTCVDFIQQSVHAVACRAIDLFVQHACLIRPLGDGGKLRLAADFAQVEMAVSPLCHRVGDLGKSYRVLRSFRPLLFQTVEHIVKSPSLGNAVPYSLVLHHLFARAEPELMSPYQVMSWSISRYSQWLDDNPSESDRLSLIQGTLEAYVKSVKERKGREFTAMYPFMLDLLQSAVQS